MSIWASEDIAGRDIFGDNHDGSVVSYINGWSNHYPGHFPPLIEEPRYQTRSPANDITEEIPASIGTGWIPPWCVPGHQDTTDDIDTAVGPWLRLDMTMCNVSVWAGVEIGNQDVHSVCMNEDAVRKLRDNLTAWLNLKKVHPRSVADGMNRC